MAPVLVAEHGVEEWRGGIGGRGGAHHSRLSELSVKFLSQNLRGLSPAKEQELVEGMLMQTEGHHHTTKEKHPST